MKDCLIVILKEPIEFLEFDQAPIEFGFNDIGVFKPFFRSDTNGFFDWLRTTEKKVIGVRWSALDDFDAEFVGKKVSHLSYVEFDSMNNLYIFFSNERDFNDADSVDQDFIDNNFYSNGNGCYALSFSTFSMNNF